MPTALRQRIVARGHQFVSRADGGSVAELSTRRAEVATSREQNRSRRGVFNRESAGWFAAAAAVVAAIFIARPMATLEPVTQSYAQAREELVARPDTLTIAWQPPTEAGYENVTGDVVWNNETQSGYMRLVGLPANDASVAQYQLWIVDPERDERPVDGGVFDVGPGGEVIVPIDAKLDIIEPAAFAITLEKPGGVVVSAGPLLVVAAAKT